jgi:type IV pilus assembly protein PilC
MSQTVEPFDAFAYQAQTAEGQSLSGTIDAHDVEHAGKLLAALRLRVLEIQPIRRPVQPKPLRGDDLLAFNQQLTHLTRAGLPVEHGLKLIAQDMRSGRIAETVRQLAGEIERGTPLDQAFEKHRGQFPPLYARLVAAGVASSNLPGMLLNLGRHMEMVYRLRAMLWRAFSYPLAVLGGLVGVTIFLGLFVIPRFELLFKEFGVQLPAVTKFLLYTPTWMPYFAIAVLLLVIGLPILWQALRKTGADRAVIDKLVVHLPLVGPVMWRNLVARWCDACRLGVQAGLDLPRAIELAGDAVASPKLRRDGHEMIGAIESGQPVDAITGTSRLLPATVPAAMALAAQNGDLAGTLAALTDMYQQQAEVRLGMIPGLLTPILILFVAGVISVVIAGLFLPLLSLIQALTH